MSKSTHIKIFSLLLVSFILFSCQFSSKQKIKHIVKQWQGKEIKIPQEDMEYKILGRDTICPELWNKPYKVLAYIDSIGCSSCRLGLSSWKQLIDSCKQQQMDIGFLFVVHSTDYDYFGHEVRFNEFDHPIIYDRKNCFDKLNHFPPHPYQTFLLDKDNKVVLIGSPINNPSMWELYKSIIAQPQ